MVVRVGAEPVVIAPRPLLRRTFAPRPARSSASALLDWRMLAACLAALLLTGCRVTPYVACPVPWHGPLPADAYERCRAVLVQRFGGLAVDDREPLRLMSGWRPVTDPVGERRAAVFVDDSVRPPGLAVVVELRWLRETWLTTPGWSDIRVDQAAERELAAELAAALQP